MQRSLVTKDPFDPDRLRRLRESRPTVVHRRVLTAIPVRKPPAERFIRVRPDPRFRIEAPILELKEDREFHWVDEALWGELADEATFRPRLLVTAIDRVGGLFLWPLRVAGPDGRLDSWAESALIAAGLAEGSWVRVVANFSQAGYDCLVAQGELEPPAWPDEPFNELLRIAFRGRTIDRPDHPVLRRLRGEA